MKPTIRRSTARDAHVTTHGRTVAAAVDDEVVALGLARDGVLDRLVEALVAVRRAHGRAQIGSVLLAEAHIELARAGQAHAIARFAEIVRQRRDKTEAAAR